MWLLLQEMPEIHGEDVEGKLETTVGLQATSTQLRSRLRNEGTVDVCVLKRMTYVSVGCLETRVLWIQPL